MAAMLSGKKTAFKTFTNKDGKKYICKLYLDDGKLSREFKQSAGSTSSDGKKVDLGKCPICGKTGVYESARFFNCSDKDCKFAQFKTVCGAELTVSDMKSMCAGNKSAYKAFTWKSGKKGKGRLYYDDAGALQFDFA
jgi:DNA topoisomerase-3